MPLRRLSLTIAAVVAIALAPAVDAAAKPPKTYKGTIVATIETDDWIDTPNPLHVSERLEVTGVRIKRASYRRKYKREKAVYKVVAGTAHWTSVETGRCTRSLDQTFDIMDALIKPLVPLAFERVARGPWNIFGNLPTRRSVDVIAQCVDAPGQEPWSKEEVVALPKLFYTGDKYALVAPKSRIKHTFRDSITNESTKSKLTWKLDLKN